MNKAVVRAFGVVMTLVASITQAKTFVVDAFTDAVDAKPGDGVCATAKSATSTTSTCTLRAAIQEANALAGADEIQLGAGTYLLSVEGVQEDKAATGDLDITQSVTIVGKGSVATTIDAQQKDRVFDIYQSIGHEMVDVTISGVTLKNGLIDYADSAGGAILSDAHLTMSDVIFDGNKITGMSGDGGALCNVGGTVDLTGVKFLGNQAQNNGGAVCNLADGVMSMINTTFDGNATIKNGVLVTHNGGAIISAGTLIARDTTFNNNYAVRGGAIFLEHGSATFIGVDVSNNTSWFHAGGVHVGSHGMGGMAMMPVEFYAANSTFNGNAILASSGSSSDDPQGGGLFVTGGSQVIIENSEIAGNDALFGDPTAVGGTCNTCMNSGGGISISVGTATFNRVRVTGNKARNQGGGIFVANNRGVTDTTDPSYQLINQVRIIQSEISGNRTGNSGGGVFVQSALDPVTSQPVATVSLEYSLVANNRSFTGGGWVGSVSATNSTISGNTADGNRQPNTSTNPISCTPVADPVDAEYGCGKGGGIYLPPLASGQARYVVRLANVTLANNSSMAPSGGTDLHNRFGADVTVAQSIFADGAGGANCSGVIVSQGYNIATDASCSFTAAGDKENAVADLVPLATNGAALSPASHAIASSSEARNRVPTASCPQFDQRVFQRTPGASCDAGAYDADGVLGMVGEIIVGEIPAKVAENAGKLVVTLDRTGGNQGVVSIEYRIRPATATLGPDGDINTVQSRGTLTWDDGDDKTKQIVIDINDDAVMERDEHFTIEIFSPILTTLANSPQIHLVTIPSSDHPSEPVDPGTGSGPVDPPPASGAPAGGSSGGGGGAEAPLMLLVMALILARGMWRNRRRAA